MAAQGLLVGGTAGNTLLYNSIYPFRSLLFLMLIALN